MQYFRYVLGALAVAALALAAGQIVLDSVGAEDEPDLQVGDKAPEVAIAEYIQGDPVRIHPEEDEEQGETDEEAKRPIHVVEFWATWCPPCRAAIPHLNALHEQYKDDKVIVVAVTNEDPDDVKPFVEDRGDEMTYTVAIDDETKTGRAYMEAARVRGIPWAFVVDREGVLVWHGHAMQVETGIKIALGEEEEDA